MQATAQNIESQTVANEIYDRLMQKSHGLRNDHILASMLASQLAGNGAMPPRLGLDLPQYEAMMQMQSCPRVIWRQRISTQSACRNRTNCVHY